MRPENFDLQGGRVTIWDLEVDESVSPQMQLDQFKEDLIQVEFGNKHVVDVGWYPEFSAKGRFVIVVIKNQDWSEPVMQHECVDFESLRENIQRAIECASKAQVTFLRHSSRQ